LHARKLPVGRGTCRAENERNQRERLFAAVAATVAEKGYKATTVADLVALSGVSRSSFYAQFDDKGDCFRDALEELLTPAREGAGTSAEPGAARAALQALIEAVVTQPAAARMCLVEAPGAGAEATAQLERTGKEMAPLAASPGAAASGREPDPQLGAALLGGVLRTIHRRLYRAQEDDLRRLEPQLWEWLGRYPPPPGPLQGRRRQEPGALSLQQRLAVAKPTERLLQALAVEAAAKGYSQVTVDDIVRRAKISKRDFYRYFRNRKDALVAALDHSSAALVAAAMPAYRRTPEWPQAVRAALVAILATSAAEPEFAQLRAVEAYAGGRRALAQLEPLREAIEEILEPGYRLAPQTPAVAGEAVAGALDTLLWCRLRRRRAATLPELAPLATYIALAPFLGADEAYAVAVGSAAAGTIVIS